jgi:hypothetical protein
MQNALNANPTHDDQLCSMIIAYVLPLPHSNALPDSWQPALTPSDPLPPSFPTWVRRSSTMPQLRVERGALVVHRGHDRPPRLHLRLIPHARCAGVAQTLPCDVCRFRDHERTRRSALGI